MKKIKYLLLLSLVATLWSCANDFLEEESYEPNIDVFKTEEGSEGLVHLLYKKANVYGGTFSLAFVSENGADTWLRGGNSGGNVVTDYNGLNEMSNDIAWLWNHFYKAVWNTNLFLEIYPEIEYHDPDKKKMRRAEVLTLQSLYLWWITETWGDVYLPKSTSMQEGLVASRSTREQFYQKIIQNLEEAIPDLPATSPELGRINQGVAKAFLARMYLYHEEWGKSFNMAKSVIEDYEYELEPSWNALWDESKKLNKEFIWTVEFSDDVAFGGGGSWYWQGYAMFIDRFAGVKTELNYTGYGGCQFLPSKYYISLFDQKADLRWKQGHQWVWLYNDKSDNTSAFPGMQTLYKDTALYLHPDILSAAEKTEMKKRFTVFDMEDMYDANGVPKDRQTFIGLTKFDDNTRTEAMSLISSRNYPILRLAEMYLIAAECNINLNQKTIAANYINELRARAVAPGYTTQMTVADTDMSIDFILEERGRELGGEHQRWFDLKRTGQLLTRVRAYNPDAAPYIKEHHLVRPIPQLQLNGMPNPETLGQNPGY